MQTRQPGISTRQSACSARAPRVGAHAPRAWPRGAGTRRARPGGGTRDARGARARRPLTVELSVSPRGPYSLTLSARLASDATRTFREGVLTQVLAVDDRVEL